MVAAGLHSSWLCSRRPLAEVEVPSDVTVTLPDREDNEPPADEAEVEPDPVPEPENPTEDVNDDDGSGSEDVLILALQGNAEPWKGRSGNAWSRWCPAPV